MVGGAGFVPNENEVNMALSPRQTGSSIKYFILAAAIQAGAQAGDVIDGVRGCVLPNPDEPNKPFVIDGGASGSVATLAQQTWSSINCAFARLSQIVGLHRVVDTVYRMSRSPYLYEGQSPEDRAPLRPYASFATGANEMSPLDMAAGMQTLANEGVHMEPYYVDYIDNADGQRLYEHVDPGTQVFERGAALTTVDILKGVLRSGTARRHPLADGRPAFGKTGTQEDNTNAWFVGATKQLTTAVWVGDPDAYTPMDNIPEFIERGVSRVQGGLFPAEIWKAFMDPAHALLPFEDWEAPPPPARPDALLVLPGVECALEIVGYEEPTDEEGEEGEEGEEPAGIRAPAQAPPPPPPPPPAPAPAEPAPTEPVETAPPVPIYAPVEVGTTIDPSIVDPTHPLPTIPAGLVVGPCG
jgi:penicillin-binding protein 1A